MAEIRLSKSVLIRAGAALIYAELAEPRSQLGLQPFLVEVREVAAGVDSDSRVFDAIERIPLFGSLRVANRIRVRIDLVSRDEIIDFEARSFPGIAVRSRFSLVPHGDGTLVEERVRADVPGLLRRFVSPLLDRAQTDLLESLKARLEARRGAG